MKFLLLLASVLSLLVTQSFAQGVVNANSLSGGVFIYVQDSSINGGVPVKIGTTATALFGTGLGKGAVNMSMYAAKIGTPVQQLESSTPIWTGFNSSSTIGTQQGSVAPGSGFVLPTQTGFDGSTPLEFVFFFVGFGTSDIYAGWSSIGTTTPITAADFNAGTIPNNVFGGPTGISSFVVPSGPEPSTIVLGTLGAAVLLLFRRRSPAPQRMP